MPKTILVVDDDEATQHLLRALLKRSGFDSVVAGNGAVAIETLHSQRFDAIVLDLMMPSVDGYAVIEYVSRKPAPEPIIVCTAAGGARIDGVHAGVVKAVVRKPFDIDELVAAVLAVTDV